MSTKLRAVPAELRDAPLGGGVGRGVPVAVGKRDELQQFAVLGERAERRLRPREVPRVAEERVHVSEAEALKKAASLRWRTTTSEPIAASLRSVGSMRTTRVRQTARSRPMRRRVCL